MKLELPNYSSNGHVNGFDPAPPLDSSGAVYSAHGEAMRRREQPTVFPPDADEISLPAVLHQLGWAHLFGSTLMRWLWLAGMALALVIALSSIAGKWYIAGAIPLLLLLTMAARRVLVMRDFLTFRPLPPTKVSMPPARGIAPSDKIPVHVSGWLDVNGKTRRFVWLPGFYRTFATRKHVLISQVRDRSILRVGRPPETDIGLWYAFFDATQIRTIAPGTVSMGRMEHAALAIVYAPDRTQGRKKNTTPNSNTETIYVMGSTDALRRIHADLLVESTSMRVTA